MGGSSAQLHSSEEHLSSSMVPSSRGSLGDLNPRVVQISGPTALPNFPSRALQDMPSCFMEQQDSGKKKANKPHRGKESKLEDFR